MALTSRPIAGVASLPSVPSGMASAGSSSMWPLLLSGLGSGLMSLFGQSSANKKAQQDYELQQQQLRQQQQQQQQNVALNESELDPWRHSMFQGADIAAMDKLERSSFTPASLSVNNKYAAQKPTVSGGYSYTKSPELIQSAAALKKLIMSGQGAPTMTNASNYGKTGAIDLLSVLAGKMDPTQATTNQMPTVTPSARAKKDREAQYYTWDEQP